MCFLITQKLNVFTVFSKTNSFGNIVEKRWKKKINMKFNIGEKLWKLSQKKKIMKKQGVNKMRNNINIFQH